MAFLEPHRSFDGIGAFCDLDHKAHLLKALFELATPRGCLDAVAQRTRRLDYRLIARTIRQSNLANEQTTRLERTVHLGKGVLRVIHKMQDTVHENHVGNCIANPCCPQILWIC